MKFHVSSGGRIFGVQSHTEDKQMKVRTLNYSGTLLIFSFLFRNLLDVNNFDFSYFYIHI
jgi:hypothetical protein